MFCIIVAWNNLVPLLKCVIANALKCKAHLKAVRMRTMRSLVLSLFSRDLQIYYLKYLQCLIINQSYAYSVYTVLDFRW